jgi:hypothetical protein
MLQALSQVHWLAVLAAHVATTVLGGVWFTVLFGEAYAKVLGRDYDPTAKPAPLYVVGPMVCSLFTIVTTAVLLKALNVATVGDGVVFGAVVGCGYAVATMMNTAINPNMPRPFAYALISGPYFLLTSVLTSAILVALG